MARTRDDFENSDVDLPFGPVLEDLNAPQPVFEDGVEIHRELLPLTVGNVEYITR